MFGFTRAPQVVNFLFRSDTASKALLVAYRPVTLVMNQTCGQAERSYYVTDPKQLWTASQLDQPNECFWIYGQMEYCDILGGYHCENFGAEWSPAVGDFVPREFLRCIREDPDPRSLHGVEMGKPVTFKEIEPCEQPNEPEYSKEPQISAASTTTSP